MCSAESDGISGIRRIPENEASPEQKKIRNAQPSSRNDQQCHSPLLWLQTLQSQQWCRLLIKTTMGSKSQDSLETISKMIHFKPSLATSILKESIPGLTHASAVHAIAAPFLDRMFHHQQWETSRSRSAFIELQLTFQISQLQSTEKWCCLLYRYRYVAAESDGRTTRAFVCVNLTSEGRKTLATLS